MYVRILKNEEELAADYTDYADSDFQRGYFPIRVIRVIRGYTSCEFFQTDRS